MLMMTIILALASNVVAADPKLLLEESINKQPQRSIQELTLTTVSAKGRQTERKLLMEMQRSDKTLATRITLTQPKEIAGIKVLIIDSPSDDDPAWLYLPALKKTTKLIGKAKNKPLMGSEFSMQDFDLNLQPGNQIEMLRETDKFWVIKITGKKLHRELTINKQSHLPMKVVQYDRKGSPSKTLEVTETQEIEGFTLPKQTTVVNHRKKTQSTIVVDSIELNPSETKLPPDSFFPEQLAPDN